MMPSLPCKSTQKMLPDDTHIAYYQKRQWETWCHHCHAKCSKNASRWYLYCIITKKGNGTWWHHCHLKVLKKCFPMISISYITKKGNILTCTNTFYNGVTYLALFSIPHDTCSHHTCLHWNVLKEWCKMMSILCRIHDITWLALVGFVGFILM